MTLIQPRAMPPIPPSEGRTPLGAVFDRLSDAATEPPAGVRQTPPPVTPVPAAGVSLAAILLARAGIAQGVRTAPEQPADGPPAPSAAADPLPLFPAPTRPAAARRKPAAPLVPAWAVPAGIAAPVLAVAIPDSPFGWGNAGAAARPVFHGTAPEPVPQTVGFVTPEDEIDAAPAPGSAAPPVTNPERPPEPPAPSPDDGSSPAMRRAPSQPPRAARPRGAPPASHSAPGTTERTGRSRIADDAPAALVEPRLVPTDEAVAPPAGQPGAMRNRRLYRRIALDAQFEVDGVASRLIDVSMGGFAAADAPRCAPNAIVPVTLRLVIDGVEIATRTRARMVYSEELRSGGRFLGLTAGQTALLRYLVTWRSQPGVALGTTTLLEAIGRPPPRSQPRRQPSPEPQHRPTARWLRWLSRLMAPPQSG